MEEALFQGPAGFKGELTTILTIPIDWAELDLFGHVNNVMFFKYMQASRLHFCEKIGLTSLNEKGKLSFMVASSRCDFKKPLYYPGKVTINTKAMWSKNTSFCQIHELLDDNQSVCSIGEDVLVLFDYTKNEKVVIAEELRRAMGL